jgi:sensor domain CHASE-containing protein
MKLRARTLLCVALSLVSLIAILYSVARVSMMRSFAALEADDTLQNLARATAVLADDLSTLDHTTSDYAAWDDTCAFLAGKNPNLPTSEFPDEWFPRLPIDFVLIFDGHGRQVFAKAYDPVGRKEREMPQGLGAHLAPGSLLMRHTYPVSKVLGIVLLVSGAVLIDSQPILDSKSRGPIRGTFLMGRSLDAPEIARLADITHLSMTVHRLDAIGLPDDVKSARAALTTSSPTLLRRLNSKNVAGYGLFKGIYGKDDLILRAVMSRKIMHQGEASLFHFLVSLLMAGFVFGLVTMLLMETLVQSRVIRLSASVAAMIGVLLSSELRIQSLRTIFMKSSTFRFMDALLPFRCCSMLMPVKKVKIISASTTGFIAGFSAWTFLAIRSLRKARLFETICCAAGGSTAN